MSRMELHIKGDPGSGNCYGDIHIDKVGTYTPNAQTVVNNQGTTVNINFNVSISISGEKVSNLFRNAQVFLLFYFILFQEVFHIIFHPRHPDFMQHVRLAKAMASVPQIWCKNAIGFISHRSWLRWSSQSAA